MDVTFRHTCIIAAVKGLQTLCLNKDESFVTHRIEFGEMQQKTLERMKNLLGMQVMLKSYSLQKQFTISIKALSNAHGQCHDDAKNMCSIKNGTSAQILSENPKPYFTSCIRHP